MIGDLGRGRAHAVRWGGGPSEGRPAMPLGTPAWAFGRVLSVRGTDGVPQGRAAKSVRGGGRSVPSARPTGRAGPQGCGGGRGERGGRVPCDSLVKDGVHRLRPTAGDWGTNISGGVSDIVPDSFSSRHPHQPTSLSPLGTSVVSAKGACGIVTEELFVLT